MEKEGEKVGARITLYLKNLEQFGNKTDFRINRSYLTPNGVLCLDLPEEIMKRGMGAPCRPQGLNDSVAGFVAEGTHSQGPESPKRVSRAAILRLDDNRTPVLSLSLIRSLLNLSKGMTFGVGVNLTKERGVPL